jgi:hypothetical protein
VSDVNPADVAGELTPTNPGQKKLEREGLPAGYRMRADAHYVDELTSRRSDRVHTDQPRGGQKFSDMLEAEPPPDPRDRRERDRRSDRVMAQLAEDLATIESAATMLSGDGAPMARRVSVDLIKVQAFRASWLLRTKALLDGTHQADFRARRLGAVLGRVRDGFAAESRLTGIALQIHAAEWNAAVTVDEAALVAGLTGAVIATLGLVGQSEYAAIRVTANVTDGDLDSIEITQEDAAVPPSTASRFFDASWQERPGGWSAGFGASVARIVAQQHGGDAIFVVGERRGSTIRLKMK